MMRPGSDALACGGRAAKLRRAAEPTVGGGSKDPPLHCTRSADTSFILNQLFGAFCLAPLHTAARFGREDLAELLLVRGRTPLHDAVYGHAGTSDLEGRVAVVKLLLTRGADINARERGNNWTPLDYALAGSANPANGERMARVLRDAGARE